MCAKLASPPRPSRMLEGPLVMPMRITTVEPGARRFWELMRLLRAHAAIAGKPNCRGQRWYRAITTNWTLWSAAPQLSLLEFVARFYFHNTFAVKGRKIRSRK